MTEEFKNDLFPADDLLSQPVAPSLRIAVSALSDIGCVRSNNEDFFGYDEPLGIYVVCDGMGGMASGEVASSRAVAAISFSVASSRKVPCSMGATVWHGC